MKGFFVRPLTKEDCRWLTPFFVEHWGSPTMVYSKGTHQCDNLPGFVAVLNGEVVGVLTYHRNQNQCEIVSLDSLKERMGIGTALIHAVEEMALSASFERIWLITTNDNLHALEFYQKRGYELAAFYRHAVNLARKKKPEIPMYGDNGIKIADELELEKRL